MEINYAIVVKYTMRGKLCVVLRSVLLRFMTADVLQESNFTIRARCRREKFVAMDMSLVSSSAVQVFSFLLIKISTVFSTTETRFPLYLTTQPQDSPCTSLHYHKFPPVPHYTTTRFPLYLTTQPQDFPCTSLHNHKIPPVPHYTTTRFPLYLTTQPQDSPCTSLHTHKIPPVPHYTTTRTLKLHDRAQSMTNDGQLVSTPGIFSE